MDDVSAQTPTAVTRAGTSSSSEWVESGDGACLRVNERGNGAPVLLVHGAIGSSRDWDDVLHRLAEANFRLISYDQRGHGLSTVGSSGFSMSAYGDDLRAVLDALDLHDTVVVGHSMGGMAILSYLATRPKDWHNRIRGIVFVSTAPSGLGDALKHRMMSPLVRRGFLRFVFSRPRLGRLFLRPLFGRSPSRDMLERARRMMAAAPAEAKVHAPISVLDFDFRPVLATIDVPVRVVVGERDMATSVDVAQAMTAALPEAELTLLPGVGHFVNLERPAVVAAAIRDLVDG